MSTKADWVVQHADWSEPADQQRIRAVRETVFIDEQHVPVELEWDELDPVCRHVLVIDRQQQPLATARIRIPADSSTAYIGRMAVLKDYRKQGVGSAMLQQLHELAVHEAVEEIELNAQTVAIPFYERNGYTKFGDEFLDAGIPHYKMHYTVNRS